MVAAFVDLSQALLSLKGTSLRQAMRRNLSHHTASLDRRCL
jgi:hypothetical protein